MSGDFISDMLDKLNKKTGREWTLADIMRLAEKLPENGTLDLDSVLNELADMGVDVSEDAKKRVKERMKDGDALSLMDGLDAKQVKGGGNRKGVKPSGQKKKRSSFWEQVKWLSTGKKKKR